MQHLLCLDCAKRYRNGIYEIYPASKEGPSELARVVRGVAKQPTVAQRTI